MTFGGRADGCQRDQRPSVSNLAFVCMTGSLSTTLKYQCRKIRIDLPARPIRSSGNLVRKRCRAHRPPSERRLRIESACNVLPQEVGSEDSRGYPTPPRVRTLPGLSDVPRLDLENSQCGVGRLRPGRQKRDRPETRQHRAVCSSRSRLVPRGCGMCRLVGHPHSGGNDSSRLGCDESTNQPTRIKLSYESSERCLTSRLVTSQAALVALSTGAPNGFREFPVGGVNQ